ncbi:type III PLP-dependent enzyme [Streptomyces sp. G5(2025)]|uniref:type III PLP-dependent enzyme n=1 Tax=Streptomyces sp. G5(2025) TaxID=3406628 RepID=UPI003C1749C3
MDRMTGFTPRSGERAEAPRSVREAAMDAPLDLLSLDTPSYVYDLAEVRRAHALLTSALPLGAPLHYSLKANPHPAVLKQLAALGCRAEVCSPGELRAALRAGFSAAGTLYTGPGKCDADVRGAVAQGVRRFSVDSPGGLDQLDRVGREHGVRLSALLRINPQEPPHGAGLAMTGGPSQFGADLSWLHEEPLLFAGRAYARLVGVHLYMGSNLADEKALLTVFEHALRVAGEAQEALGCERFEVLDLGGGFGAPYATRGRLPVFATLRERLGVLLDRAFPAWRTGSPEVFFESGRYLSAACGQLLTRVLDVKRSHGCRIVVLDAGINHLGGMSGLGREPRIDPELLTTADGRNAGHETIVTGPLCHPLDSWTRNGLLPDVEPGELIAVPNVGAYGLHSSLALFHGHPMPLEVVVDDGREIERSRITVGRERYGT